MIVKEICEFVVEVEKINVLIVEFVDDVVMYMLKLDELVGVLCEEVDWFSDVVDDGFCEVDVVQVSVCEWFFVFFCDSEV